MTAVRKRPTKAAIIGRALPVYAGPAAAPVPPIDMADVAKQIEAMNSAFAEFKAANDEHLKSVAKKFDDVVAREKVERINDTITRLDGDIARMNAQLSAVKLTAANDGGATPERTAHRASFGKYVRKGVDAGLQELAVKASLTTDSNPDGGYTVPVEIDQAVTRVLTTDVAMRQLASVRTVGGQHYTKLHNLGGTTSGWVGERESRSETSTPTLSALTFTAHEIYAMPGATQTMLDDSFLNVEQWLADEVRIALADAESDAFLNGNGVNKPFGFMSATKIANASYSWGKLGFVVSGASADFASSNPSDAFIDLQYSLKRGYTSNATWLMARATIGKVRKFKDGQGNYIWQPTLVAGAPSTLLGHPVAIDDYMPVVGSNTYPVAFGDFRRGYLIVDRVGIRVLRDPYSSKPYVLFYTTKRVGGGIQDYDAIKLMKCST